MTTNRDSREKRLRHDTASTAPLDTYLVSGCRRDLEPRRCLVCVCVCVCCVPVSRSSPCRQRREIKTSPRQFDLCCRTRRRAVLYQTPIF